MHLCFQEKPAKILKQSIEGLGCGLSDKPVAFGTERFVCVSRDENNWSKRRTPHQKELYHSRFLACDIPG